MQEIAKLLIKNPLFENYISTAFQEYVEALQFYHFVINNNKLENIHSLISLETIQEELPIPYTSYLHGLCDYIGELRRYALDSIRIDEIDKGERSLIIMDEIFIQLTSLDYPGGLLPGIRRKTDIARNLIERTRGDVTLAYNRSALSKKLENILKYSDNEKSR